jgi:hypothetical protein
MRFVIREIANLKAVRGLPGYNDLVNAILGRPGGWAPRSWPRSSRADRRHPFC